MPSVAAPWRLRPPRERVERDDQTGQHQLHPLPDYQANDLRHLRAESHANADLFRSLTDRIGEHAEEPDGREYECEYAEETQQAGIQPLLAQLRLCQR